MKEDIRGLKVAVVHDWLVNYGGAERVVEAILEIFPQAEIYTLVYDRDKMGAVFPEERIHTTFIQKIPRATKIYTKLLPLMPKAFEELDLTGYDLVISSSSCCAKGVITSHNTVHIAYIHSPMRYAWDLYFDYKNKSGRMTKLFMGLFMTKIREWDETSSIRIDKILANSRYISRRIRKYWGRESQVVFPPVEVKRLGWNGREPEDYYVAFSRLVPYKRVDIAVLACKELNRKLVVIGDGDERKNLESIAGETITFTGRISDEEVKRYLQGCRALIFCAEEDFGIVPVEAQACGRPVIAFGRGGARETVVEGETGVFFKEQNSESLKREILRFEDMSFDPEKIRTHAEKFSKERFKEALEEVVTQALIRE